MQKNEVVSNDESDINDKRKEKLKKLFEYEETRENGKIVLLNKKLKLVQLTDCKEDREIYKTVTADYNDFLKKFRKTIRTSNLDELFDEEVLHKNHENFPLFACYNSRNELIGTFGSRNAIVVKNGNKEITLQELSGRLMQKYIRTGKGAMCEFMVTTFMVNKGQNFFIVAYKDERDFISKMSQYCGLYQFICSKNRQMDGTPTSEMGEVDFYSTIIFEGIADQLY